MDLVHVSASQNRFAKKVHARIVLAISMSRRARSVAVSEIALLNEFHGCA
jgi:hypothetical protein